MKRLGMTMLLATVLGSAGLCSASAAANVTLVRDGQPRAVIHVPERLWDDPQANSEPPLRRGALANAEDQRRRLRESVRDLVGIIERISGARIEVKVGLPEADDNSVPILIAELAEARFGQPQQSYRYAQGFRIVADDGAIGLVGESDLAVSYAIYTLLDDLGCRWFMPGELGEALPSMRTIEIPRQDRSTGPYTWYRGVWYSDNDYMRRNRLGGMRLAAGHTLEHSVPNTLREQHPEIRAVINGQPHRQKIKWTHPIVTQFFIDRYLGMLEQDPSIPTFSLSPMDGIGWDEEYDTRYDADDFDAAADTVSKTDRIIVMANRIAEGVTGDYPDVLFGMLAYVDYTRPPVREQVHPNVVPQIAPITYSRAHPMSDPGEPNNADLRDIVEGWGRVVQATSYYFYGWFLAELSGPNPMIRKWSKDIPFVYEKGACRFWQPETISNFESSMHALHLGNRMAWDPSQDPALIIDELHQKFYGNAAGPMAAYWHYVDHVWVDVPEYGGCGWGHLRRFTPERMSRMRELLDAGKAAAQTDTERARIHLADLSLTMFEQFMQMRHDLAEGLFANLATDAQAYMDRMHALGEEYAGNFTFGRVGWGGFRNVNLSYFNSFYKRTYDDAARIAAEHSIITPAIRNFRYQVDKQAQGEDEQWYRADRNDSEWPETDVCVETWSSLGLHNYMGRVWYRTNIDVPRVADGKRVHLWIGATDGSAKLFVNGQHVPFINDQGESVESFRGYAQPGSFDVTEVIRPEQSNQVTLLTHRLFLNELGSGGLMAPAVLYLMD